MLKKSISLLVSIGFSLSTITQAVPFDDIDFSRIAQNHLRPLAVVVAKETAQSNIATKLADIQKVIDEDNLLVARHLNRAIEVNRNVPASVVDINEYVKAGSFKKWFFYELPAEVFVTDFWGDYLTDKEANELKGRFFATAKSRISLDDERKVMDVFSTNEMEALFLDMAREILGQRRFNEIIAEAEKHNVKLDNQASREYDKLANKGMLADWQQRIKLSALSELIAADKKKLFDTQITSEEAIAVNDSTRFAAALLDNLTDPVNQKSPKHYLHVVSHHGAVIFDLEIFALGFIKEWLARNIPEDFGHLDWQDIEAVKDALRRYSGRIKDQFQTIFAVKSKRTAPTDVTVEDIKRILSRKRFRLLKTFMEFGLFGIVNTSSQTRGMNLNDASDEFIKTLVSAALIGVKGEDNTITANLLNKDYFVFGTAIGHGGQRYTGLRFNRGAGQIPTGFVAFVPGGIPATCEIQFDVPPRQNLRQFIEARQRLNQEEGVDYNDLIKERMQRGDTFVEATYPEILGDTAEAKEALRRIREIADSEKISFLSAIKVYVENGYAPDSVKNAMFDYTVLELNRAFNEQITKGLFAGLPGQPGEYRRVSYKLKSDKDEKGNKIIPSIGEPITDRETYRAQEKDTKILVNVLRLGPEALKTFTLSGVQASDKNLDLIAPEKVAQDEFQDATGIIANFLYFFTERLRREYNAVTQQVDVAEHFAGSYVGFQKDRKTGEVFTPLYNKGAIAFFRDGRIKFGRVRLYTGKLTINDSKPISWMPFDQYEKMNGKERENVEAIAYTPMCDGNIPENKSTHFGSTEPKKKTSRRILTPVHEDRINIVIFRNEIIQIREGQAEIPPAGWALSVRRDIFKKIKSSLELAKRKDKDGEGEHFLLTKKPRLKFDYKLPKGWEEAYWIMGGATLTYPEIPVNELPEGGKPSSDRHHIFDIMRAEGWNYNSSRQTQETDLSEIAARGPRQVLVQAKDQNFYIFTFSGRSDMSGGVTHAEALDVIKEELNKDNKEPDYALNLDGGSSVCMAVAKNGQFYPLNITGKGDVGTGDVRPVNGVLFLRVKPATKSSSAGTMLDTAKINSLNPEALDKAIAFNKGVLKDVYLQSKYAAEISEIARPGNTIVINDATIPENQKAVINEIYDKNSPLLKELERITGSTIRLLSQLDKQEGELIIISHEKLPQYDKAKYLMVKETEIYLPLAPLVAIAKLLIGAEGKTAEELKDILNTNDLYRSIFRCPVNERTIQDFIKTGIFELPTVKMVDYDELEQLQRQALAALIAA